MSNPLDPEKLFGKGGPLEKLFPLYEAGDTIVRTPSSVTRGPSHVRDALDLKRMMITVVVALTGCVLMAMYNTGLQAHLAIEAGAAPLDSPGRRRSSSSSGCSTAPTASCRAWCTGALYYLPVLAGHLRGRRQRRGAVRRRPRGTRSTRASWSPACCSRWSAADNPVVASRARHHVRRHLRQGDFRRHGDEHPERRAQRTRVSCSSPTRPTSPATARGSLPT